MILLDYQKTIEHDINLPFGGIFEYIPALLIIMAITGLIALIDYIINKFRKNKK